MSRKSGDDRRWVRGDGRLRSGSGDVEGSGGEMNPQLGLFPRSPGQRVPELTLPMRIALEAIELCAGEPFCGRQFRRPGGDPYQITAGILRKLLREGLIEVMGLGPAVYRLTKLGRVARSLG